MEKGQANKIEQILFAPSIGWTELQPDQSVKAPNPKLRHQSAALCHVFGIVG